MTTLPSTTTKPNSSTTNSPATSSDIINLLAPVTPEEADWAESNLRGLPTVISFDSKSTGGTAVSIYNDSDSGKRFRYAGKIIASPGGQDRFRIWLARGATMRDLRFLERIVANARDGALLNHGWHAIEHSDRPMTFEFSAGRSWPASLEAKERHIPTLRPCKDKACIESYHDDGKAKEHWHVAEAFSGASWEIETFRVGDAPWSVFIDCKTDKLSPSEAMSISKALSVAAATVDRLNREAAAHV